MKIDGLKLFYRSADLFPFLHISETCLLLPELRTKAIANIAIDWDITGQRAFEGGPGDLIIIYELFHKWVNVLQFPMNRYSDTLLKDIVFVGWGRLCASYIQIFKCR